MFSKKKNKMRLFVYKLLISIIAIFFLYHLTIGYTLYSLQIKIFTSLNKNTVIKIKEKLMEEISSSLKKDKILNEEDAILFRQLIKKINSELKE